MRSPRTTPRPTAQRTRERILDASLAMFNALGEPNVSTNHIADETGISPGNLYYHFRSKDDIVEQLFAGYEARIDEALLLPDTRAPDLEDLWLQLHLLFEAISQYRFLHRDLVDILTRNRRIRSRFSRILDRASTSARTLLQALAQAGILHASDEDLHSLVENAIALVTFWIGFDTVRSGHYDGSRSDPGVGIRRVLGLLTPYLDPAARAHFARLTDAYGA
ncbi:MAG: TetR/AcrR family transcriptional regulator [Dokdonella sp.]|uniref:TetR/AcrR family transcriptional regulator n=1 Tax=Dokdonella sp. TaxID=2291710 RepID=UPI0025B872F8|nr:TetR/AcrR family transcriptional regulator [Dokdonella sp.]MBZ0223180.1 TetR/AcrR family transcriptional regulator [Dokdonella sp.]MCC7255172.1 TetR/AcrR family transcriptional regulator [Dokdonella sp.]